MSCVQNNLELSLRCFEFKNFASFVQFNVLILWKPRTRNIYSEKIDTKKKDRETTEKFNKPIKFFFGALSWITIIYGILATALLAGIV